MPSGGAISSDLRARGCFEIRVAGRPVVGLMAGRGRVRMGLVVAALDRLMDISAQPNAPGCALSDRAVRAGVAPGTVEADARSALSSAASAADAWTPSHDLTLSHAFGGIAFPMLAAAYDLGGAPLGEVPRWAEPILAARTIGDAAAVAFGGATSRPVRRALVEALVPLPNGEMDLAAVAFGWIGAAVMPPDRLARVLGADRVGQRGVDLTDTATLHVARRVLAEWGATRTERLLVEAIARPDGASLLFDTIRFADELVPDGPPHPLPTRLVELHDAHRSLIRTAAPVAAPERLVRRATVGRRPHRALRPPPTQRPPSGHPVALPEAVEALDGETVDDLTFVVPRTSGDLRRWGREMSNCLGDFAPAVESGLSIIIGVRHSNRLLYAVEVTPQRALRQFCGRANRVPNPLHNRIVLTALVAAGVIDEHLAAHRR